MPSARHVAPADREKRLFPGCGAGQHFGQSRPVEAPLGGQKQRQIANPVGAEPVQRSPQFLPVGGRIERPRRREIDEPVARRVRQPQPLGQPRRAGGIDIDQRRQPPHRVRLGPGLDIGFGAALPPP